MRGLEQHKYVYADTNVVSDICKPDNGLLKAFLSRFLPDYLFCFSTYTLYEISKNDYLMERFHEFYSVFPCVIIQSYFPLAMKEFEVIEGTSSKVNPLLLSPQAIEIDGKKINPKSLQDLLEHDDVVAAINQVEVYTDSFFEEMKMIFDSEEFQGISVEKCNKNQFVGRFKKYEFRHRFLNGKKLYGNFDKKKVKRMKSLEVLAQGIYYKFYSDLKRKVSKSDIIDVLIMTSAPYAETFISENNCVDIYRKILNSNNCDIKNNLMTIKELRKY